MTELKKRLGLQIPGKDVNVNELIGFLKKSHYGKDPKAPKSELKDKEWKESLYNTGLNINAQEDSLKYWFTPAQDISASELPDQWDWRNIGGESFVGDAISQVK